MPADELLTPAETAIASRATLKEVYKVARERLPSGLGPIHIQDSQA